MWQPYARMRHSASKGFTLIELLVVTAIISILAAVLFPAFARAKDAAKQSVCLSSMKQIGMAFQLYLSDEDDRFPDRRDLKTALGFRPWPSWPPSDPRAGWAAVVLEPYVREKEVWSCPSVKGSSFGEVPQVRQDTPMGSTRYWLWRFDRTDDPVPLDDFWGKTPDVCVTDLQRANNPQAGNPTGVADVELMVDPYFPETIPSILPELKGKAVHSGGRNRLFLDLHAKWMRDPRTH